MTINPNLIKKILIGVIITLVLLIACIFGYFGSVQKPGEQTRQDLNKATQNLTGNKLFNDFSGSSSSYQITQSDTNKENNSSSTEISTPGDNQQLSTETEFSEYWGKDEILNMVENNIVQDTTLGKIFKMGEDIPDAKIPIEIYLQSLTPVDNIEFNGRLYLYNKDGKIQPLGDQILKIFVTQINGKEYWVYEEATGMQDSILLIAEPGLVNPLYSEELLDTAQGFESIKDLGEGRFEIKYYMIHDYSEEKEKTEELYSVKKATINLKRLIDSKDQNTKVIE